MLQLFNNNRGIKLSLNNLTNEPLKRSLEQEIGLHGYEVTVFHEQTIKIGASEALVRSTMALMERACYKVDHIVSRLEETTGNKNGFLVTFMLDWNRIERINNQKVQE